MKIIFAIPRLTYSGAPKMMAWVANQMAARGHEVKFVTFFSEEKLRELHPGVDFHYLGGAQSKSRLLRNTLGMVQMLKRLDAYVMKEKPDIFVSFLDSIGYMYLPIAKKRCKVVVSERVDPYVYKGGIAKIRFKLMEFAHKTVFQTEGAQNFFRDKKKIYENSVVIPNPVVLSERVAELQKAIPFYKERDNRIVAVGRLSLPQKRQDVLLQAFSLVYARHPELQLVIYGDGADKNKIQSLIDEMGLTKAVTLAGRTDFPERDILHARAFVLSSDFEGIPNSLIEALSVGVPSVSTDCSPGGAALLIQNGENGYLVPRADVQTLAEQLSKIIEEEETANLFTRNGPQIVEKFSETAIVDLWEDCFLNLK